MLSVAIGENMCLNHMNNTTLPFIIVIIEKSDHTNFGENTEGLELSSTIEANIKWCHHFGELFDSLLKS